MLRRILNLVLILALLSAALPAPAEEADARVDEAFTYHTLKRGDRDGDDSSEILALQNRLIELGYLRDTADGIFGDNTQKAVSTLQRNNSLEETGEASPDFQDLLFSGADLVTFAETNEPESETYRIQQKLDLWGFYAGIVDGTESDDTLTALDAFRNYLPEYTKLHPLPTPDPQAVQQDAIVVDQPLEGPAGTITDEMRDFFEGVHDFDVYRETVAGGDEGDEVYRIQRRLHQLKYLAVVDGVYGADTERALLYFQKKNDLPLSAVADEDTQRLLFSEGALEAEEFVNAYKLVVDVSEQRVHIYQWNGSDYDTQINEMICSTGVLTPAKATPLGTYQAAGPTGTGEWYWFSTYECYAKWATRIVGGILFHSVTYSKGKALNRTSLRKLGHPASHGCVRLKVDDAKWIYENCPAGTTVVIQD